MSRKREIFKLIDTHVVNPFAAATIKGYISNLTQQQAKAAQKPPKRKD